MSASVEQAPRGILLTGLRVVGLLDLEQFCFALPLALRDCTVNEGIRLDRAVLGALDLSGSRFPFLSARRARVSGDLVLQGLMETDWIDLGEARIAGHLSLAGSHLNPTGKDLRKPRSPKGFRERSDQALHCWGAEIGLNVWMSDGFTAHGEISFCGATIGQHFCCMGVTLTNPTGSALFCAGISVGATAVLMNTTTNGIVNFAGGDVGGNFTCGGASLSVPPDARDDYAQSHPAALNLASVHVKGMLDFVEQRSPITSLCLRGAQIEALADDPSSWPEHGRLELDGLVYQGFSSTLGMGGAVGTTPLDYRSRLDWLERQVGEDLYGQFKSQPWTQCAKALAAAGRTHDARMILYERERRWLRSKQQHVVTRLFYRFILGPLSGYGYRTHWALYWALGIWLAGSLVFAAANDFGMMRPASEHVLVDEEYKKTGAVPRDYEPLKPMIYSADLLLPIIEIGQDRYWIPRDASEAGQAIARKLPHASDSPSVRSAALVFGWLPKTFYYLEIAMGWLLVSIVIAGFSKVLRHVQED